MVVLPGCPDERRRVASDLPFVAKVLAEGANRRELPGRRGAGVAALVQIAEERPDVRVDEVAGRQIGAALADGSGQERQELREIAFVGADRVRRRVVVEGEVLEEAVELLFQSVAAAPALTADDDWIQSSSAASDRSA